MSAATCFWIGLSLGAIAGAWIAFFVLLIFICLFGRHRPAPRRPLHPVLTADKITQRWN